MPWVAFAQGVVRLHVLLLCRVDCFAGQASLAMTVAFDGCIVRDGWFFLYMIFFEFGMGLV